MLRVLACADVKWSLAVNRCNGCLYWEFPTHRKTSTVSRFFSKLVRSALVLLYHEDTPDEEHFPGKCRLNPPIVRGRITNLGIWPVTYPYDWCGHWKPSEETVSIRRQVEAQEGEKK